MIFLDAISLNTNTPIIKFIDLVELIPIKTPNKEILLTIEDIAEKKSEFWAKMS